MSDIEQPTYRPDALVAPLSIARRPGEVDRVNALLEGAGLGRPVGVPEDATSALALLPVAADALVVVTKLREVGGGPDSLAAQLDIDPLLRAATFDGEAVDQRLYPAKDIGHDFIPLPDKNIGHGPAADKNIGHLLGHGAFGPLKDIGHAPVSWVSLETGPAPIPWQPSGAARRRVVALLDTGVADHWWLRVGSPGDPFVVDAAQSGWRPLRPLPPFPGLLGGHQGHGTFNAGVIRQTAPAAQVLSIDVMTDAGLVSEVAVVGALEWLITTDRPVDAVVMPFGRRWQTDGDNGLTRRHLETAVNRLGDRVRIVAAVGSDGGNRPTYPAAYPDSPVIGVGSGVSADRHDPFSEHGTWVEAWEAGKEAVSILPVTTMQGWSGFTRWSGTSFAAVRHAARLAGS